MPAILVELGFLSNTEEEDYLHSEDGQTYMASAIYRAFKEFMEKTNSKKDSKDNSATVETPKKQEPKSENPIVKNEPVKETVKVTDSPIIWKEVDKGIKYQVQILSSPKPLDKKSSDFKGLEKVESYILSGVHKYLVGSTKSFKEAKKMQDHLRSMGFKDAFVVAFENGQRVDLSKAIAQSSE